jgi:hypothetical protein
MKPVVKDVTNSLRTLLPVAKQALNSQIAMKLDERITAINQWRELTSPAMITALLDRIDQLEKLWVEPTKDMVNAGLGEVQRITEEWDETWDFDLAEISDDQASDMAVFTLQAMASKLPKEPD